VTVDAAALLCCCDQPGWQDCAEWEACAPAVITLTINSVSTSTTILPWGASYTNLYSETLTGTFTRSAPGQPHVGKVTRTSYTRTEQWSAAGGLDIIPYGPCDGNPWGCIPDPARSRVDIVSEATTTARWSGSIACTAVGGFTGVTMTWSVEDGDTTTTETSLTQLTCPDPSIPNPDTTIDTVPTTCALIGGCFGGGAVPPACCGFTIATCPPFANFDNLAIPFTETITNLGPIVSNYGCTLYTPGGSPEFQLQFDFTGQPLGDLLRRETIVRTVSFG
jgi:hypothetical protein